MVFALQNDFAPATSQLGHLQRVKTPGSFTFTWYPDLVGTIDHAGQAGAIGPSGDYWISGLSARTSSPGTVATVQADSKAIRQPSETASESFGPSPGPEPTPAATDAETWTAGTAPATRQAVTLNLTNVAGAAIDTSRAGLRCGTITVTTDGPTALTLLHLRSGSRAVELQKGTTALTACSTLTGR